MTQDDLRIDSSLGRQQRDLSRAQQMVGENAGAAEAVSSRMAEAGADGLGAGLRAQTEMVKTLQDIGLGWMERRTAETEFVLSLPNRFAGVRTFPDAVAIYHSWLSGWFALCQEDGLRLLADSRKIATTAARCFTNTSPTRSS
jgi:hypothetical protein